MFGNKKKIYVSFTDRSFQFLVMDGTNHNLLDKDEIAFDSPIIEDGKVVNEHLLETSLKNVVKTKKWKNAPLYFIVPDQFVTMKEEEIPANLTKAEGKEYIKLQLGSGIRLPFKNPVIDFEKVETSEEDVARNKQRILLFAYPSDRIIQMKRLFERADLEPNVADISFLSLYRAFRKLVQTSTQPHERHLLMIQWHKFDIALTVFNNQIPLFNRHTHIAGAAQSWKKDETTNKWTWMREKEDLDRTIDEQFMSIDRFMDFYRYSVMDGEASVTDILITGGFPMLKEVQAVLASQYDLRVHQLKLPFGLDDDWSVLYGLTLKDEALEKKAAEEKAEKKELKKRSKQGKERKKLRRKTENAKQDNENTEEGTE